ncbi:PDZ domain-containing protein [Olivibacter sp. SDN3]|uniref:PDZ domain-containing protein n=1 Tax=Olivibacter sp. SDN3 TaxID=2764720 RepID=UPI0016517FD8|nr:PDZ domain-containing protein [Olivibacter sp. SDN3]QNL50604.1 PDZ domain-containing protein [Olivibacter sp. SDN3]
MNTLCYRTTKYLLCCLILVTCTVICNGQTKQLLYVSTTGDDRNNGSKEAPFANPLAAKKAIAVLKKSGYTGSIELIIEEGTYYLDQPMLFSAEESGEREHPYIIRAAEGHQVVFSAGVPLDLSWQKHDEKIWKAAVPAGISFETLFANGRQLIRARYPNYDFNILPFNGYSADAISQERTKNWKNPVEAYIHALHSGRWGGFHYKVVGRRDNGTLQLTGGQQNNRPSPMHETYRYVENVFEELDSPQEWYLDTAARTLYYYPAPEEDPGKLHFEVSQLENIITLEGSEQDPIHDIIIEGIHFMHTAPTFMKTAEPLLRSDWTIYRQGAVKIEGAERCKIRNADFSALGGNAIFVSKYNRAIDISGNLIENIGAGAINVVGSEKAVRSPAFRYEDTVPLAEMDTISGPQTIQYPSAVTISDNLIRNIGRIEKQVAGVQIAMASEISVIHNTIYNVPRAGINIGDGTWGGHLLAHNDVFKTVLETSDHGAFNSWGRDRFWHPDRAAMDTIAAQHPTWVTLDAIKTTVIRNNRFQCDHGWDIDLDDGSTNYAIYNNLCLSGGLKLREGFFRTVYNNVIVNNGFHPHVWFKNSHDVFRNNLVMQAHQDIQVNYWGDTIDYNLYIDTASLQEDKKKGIEAHSIVIAPSFIDPASGDFRLKDTTQSYFTNFDMHIFGVTNPRLRKIAEQPSIPRLLTQVASNRNETFVWEKSTFKNIETLGEQSAAGLPNIAGVLLIGIPKNSPLYKSGLKVGDVIVNCEGKQVDNFHELLRILENSQYKESLKISIYRNQQIQPVEVQR